MPLTGYEVLLIRLYREHVISRRYELIETNVEKTKILLSHFAVMSVMPKIPGGASVVRWFDWHRLEGRIDFAEWDARLY